MPPTWADPLVRWLSEGVGGPRGRHAGPTGRVRRWQPSAVALCLVFATGTLLVAVLTREPCRHTLWASPGQFTNACYSDLPTVFSANGLAETLPYLGSGPAATLGQPLGTGLLLWGLGVVTPGGAQQLRWVFDAGSVLVLVALLVIVVLVARLAGPRPWDAALVAASPVVVAVGVVSLDLVAVALTVAAVRALSRDRPALAGVLLAAAICVRPTAVVVLIALALVQWRRRGLGLLAPTMLATGLTWALVNVPVALAAPGWGAYWNQLFSGRVGLGSLWVLPSVVSDALAAEGGRDLPTPPLWLAGSGAVVVLVYAIVLLLLPRQDRAALLPLGPIGMGGLAGLIVVLPILGVTLGPGAVGLLEGGRGIGDTAGRWIAGLGMVATVAAVAALVARAPRPPRLPVVILLLLAGFLVSAPAVPVQAALWILPFAALAVPSWRDLLIWGSSEFFLTTITWFHLYGLQVPDRGAPPWVYALAVLLRFAALGYLVWQAATQSLWVEDDVVRRTAQDDPCLSARAQLPVAAVQRPLAGVAGGGVGGPTVPAPPGAGALRSGR